MVESAAEPEQPTVPGVAPIDRRRRKRAKMAAQIRLRLINSPTPFQEVCKTIDVSRDGVLFVSPHSGYWVGQRLEVTFPYSTDPSALNHPQPAQVVRVFESGRGLFGVGVQFAAAASREVKSAAGNGTSANPARSSSSAVVLAVESDPRMADLLRQSLQPDGYSVVIVPTAQAALDILKTTVPVVFVTNTKNSDIDGHDLCLIVKRSERLQHIPIILLTQSAQPADNTSQQLGAVISIAKSSNPDRLVQMIRLLAPPPSKSNAYGVPVQKDLESAL
jgi:CheY-like chemotaxis protein